MAEPDIEKRRGHVHTLGEDSAHGRKLRTELQEAFSHTEEQFSAAGCEMNHLYRSTAIYIEDEDERTWEPVYAAEKDMHYTRGTIPGMRLPHVWLVDKASGDITSTQDLAGKGQFTLFTGIGGTKSWELAAAAAEKEVPGSKIAVFTIGWNQEFLDTEGTWTKLRGVEDDGAVLVRPDRFVCWRSRGRADSEATSDKLTLVLKSVLGWDRQI